MTNLNYKNKTSILFLFYRVYYPTIMFIQCITRRNYTNVGISISGNWSTLSRIIPLRNKINYQNFNFHTISIELSNTSSAHTSDESKCLNIQYSTIFVLKYSYYLPTRGLYKIILFGKGLVGLRALD